MIGLTALAALLRFSTLGVQNFWIDEAATAALVKQDFGGMLSTLPYSDSNPPLYYVLAWAWSRIFGTSEVGLRSLSALIGVATVPVVYLAASKLISQRVALFATLLAAVSPVLVWYSQEARAYALLFFLIVLSLWLLARCLEAPSGRTLAAWAAACIAALSTHYFAIFFVGAEAAAALLVLGARRRGVLIALGAIVAAGACLLPLAVEQANQGVVKSLALIPLKTRITDAGRLFIVGPTGQYLDYAVLILAVLSVAAVCLLLWSDAPVERYRALGLALVGFLVALIPVLLDAAGKHYLDGRNLLPLWLPLALLVGAGVVGTRKRVAGLLIGAALVLASLAATVAVPLDRQLQRERLTAGFGGLPFDAGTRVAAQVRFLHLTDDRAVRDTARCPDGYDPATGRAQLLINDPEKGRLPSHRAVGGRNTAPGWTANTRLPTRTDGVVLVYAVCTRPG